MSVELDDKGISLLATLFLDGWDGVLLEEVV